MGSKSGGGGGQTTTVTVPDWYNAAAQNAANTAQQLSKIGYMAFPGAQVAAFTPQQISAMNMSSDLARAYGYDVGDVQLPTPIDYGGGLMGYSGIPWYYQALAQFEQMHPEQAQRYASYYGNPLPVDLRDQVGANLGFSYVPPPPPPPAPVLRGEDLRRAYLDDQGVGGYDDSGIGSDMGAVGVGAPGGISGEDLGSEGIW